MDQKTVTYDNGLLSEAMDTFGAFRWVWISFVLALLRPLITSIQLKSTAQNVL
jgi:hypothetical protein